MGYRDVQPRQTSVPVRYWKQGPIGMVLTLSLLTVWFAAMIAVWARAWRDFGWAGGIVWWAGLSALPWLAFYTVSHAQVNVDVRAQTLTIRWVRWPLLPRERAFPLGRVNDVIVRTHDGDDTTYSVELLVEGQEPVALLDVSSPDRERQERVAHQIRERLAVVRTGNTSATP